MKASWYFALPLLASLCSTPALAQQEVQIKGSDTLIFLGQRISNFYRRGSSEIAINVTGGGAPTPISRSQIGQWEGSSTKASVNGAIVFPVGVQALVVYVHRSNPVHELTLSQLRKIFLGEITNWKDLGGADATILLYAGESTTGNLPYFQDAILRGEEPYPFVGKSNTTDLLNEIAQNPNAIGYGSPGSHPDVKTVQLKIAPGSFPIEPNSDNVRSRSYPVTRYIYWATSSNVTPQALALCRWVLSSDGQLAVESAGFEPLLPKDRAAGLARLATTGAARIMPAAFPH